MKKRTIALLMAVVMLFGVVVGGTVAWLKAETGSVVNTFSVGDINIELKEHDYDPESKKLLEGIEHEVTEEDDYKIIPGTDLLKDPFVRIIDESEECWVFVRVTPDKWPTSNVTYTIDSTWTALKGVPDVYWQKVESLVGGEVKNEELNILAGQKIEVTNELTKEQIETIKAVGNPTLTFTAYAVQAENFDTAEAAWAATFGE
ncbi:MAG: hypothetical protein IKA09_06485 [Lachnospiraceae bacterium]|nr:hypothetical protein [Lachnospiraceae bacterium]